jgi:hypothetical protein
MKDTSREGAKRKREKLTVLRREGKTLIDRKIFYF